jgi:hypothetical protein
MREDFAIDDIKRIDDPALLNQIHSDLLDIYDDVRSAVDNCRFAGTADEAWLRRAAGKMTWCQVAMKRIERRLLALGHEHPITRDGKEREIIRVLRNENKQLRYELAKSQKVAP